MTDLNTELMLHYGSGDAYNKCLESLKLQAVLSMERDESRVVYVLVVNFMYRRYCKYDIWLNMFVAVARCAFVQHALCWCS